jgi:GNAT superfamily N-acetyltransferase
MSSPLIARWRRRTLVARRTRRDLGLGGVALRAVQRLTPSWLGQVECFVVLERAALPDPPAEGLAGFRWAGPPDIDRIAALGRPTADLDARLSRGDCVVVAEEGGRVVAQQWYERGRHEEEGIEFPLAHDEIWSYDGLVLESHRGRGIHRRLVRAADPRLAAEGVARVLTAVELVNRPALRSAARGRGRRIGLIVLVRLDGLSLRREEWGGPASWRIYRGRAPVALPPPGARRHRPVG